MRGVPEASERKERGTNEWSEDAGSTGTLNGRFLREGKGQMYPCNAMKGILLPCGALGFSTEQLKSTGKCES